MNASTDLPDGSIAVSIDDRVVEIDVGGDEAGHGGGMRFSLPIGPFALLDGPLEHADPPSPTQLTNALGLVHDHFDDVIIAAPDVVIRRSVVVTGPHATGLARVEIGADTVPDDYRLDRGDADEVFRTLAAERAAERRHNPGIVNEQIESIVATCCVILGIMRRLDLHDIGIRNR